MDKIGQQVANRLLSKIVDGVYGREGRLPAERELAVQMEASRPSVREALQILEQWSVVSIRPGSGTAVRPVREWQLDVLRAAPSQPGLAWNKGNAITDELLQLRRAFYRDVAERLGSKGVAPYALQGARDAVERAWACREDAAVFGMLELEVMRQLLEAAAMLPSLWMLNQLAAVYGPVLQARAHGKAPIENFREAHLRFFSALEERNVDLAREALEDYLDEVEEALYVEAA